MDRHEKETEKGKVHVANHFARSYEGRECPFNNAEGNRNG